MNREQIEFEKERIRMWFAERDNRRKASEPIAIPPRKRKQIISITIEDENDEPDAKTEAKTEEKKSD
jgi:hypothetical protein